MKKQTEKAAEQTEKIKYETIEETFDDISAEDFDTSNMGDYDQVYFVKPKTKDAAYFEFSQKKGNTIAKDPRTTIQAIDGNVTKIELDSYTYEKKEIKTIKIHLSKQIKEKKILFMLSSSFTQVGRSIINSLLGVNEPIEKMNIVLYINNAGFTSVKTLINGKKADWKHSIEFQKQHIEEIKNKKGEITLRDYTDLDELFNDELQNHLSVLFPNETHRKIIEETFGDKDDASGFFEIDEDKD